MIAAGHVDPHNLRFAPARVAELDRRSRSGGIGLDAALEKASHVYQQLAELPAPDRVPLLRELLLGQVRNVSVLARSGFRTLA